ncbi:addiction module family protein [Sinomicrobium kalidii]|uniref:addiction module family protein n=1 Tax=Sinomicrobium kalidii TaxID=2900738 RepID=UPI001E29C58F|nr:addiction module family protein [Sinomicrobium kalidii]UGU14720.1 addiction module family protein [Sinomicrobium kalidii]
MDTSIDLRNRIKKYIEHADERILKIFNAIIETETEEPGLTPSHKEIIDIRLKHHRENPTDGKDWDDIKASLKQQYGL